VRLPIQRSRKDVLAGLLFVGFGGAFALGASAYDFGDPVRPGPGFYPVVIGVLLAVLGVAIIVRGTVDEDDGPITPPSWRAVAMILGALAVFALTVRGLGLGPAVFVTALLASLASRETTIRGALVMAVGLTAVSIVIFAVALNLRLPLLGPMIPRF
jgi:Tripartite tricarboxylate transporter TctB family